MEDLNKVIIWNVNVLNFGNVKIMVELINSRCQRWGGEMGESIGVINFIIFYNMGS